MAVKTVFITTGTTYTIPADFGSLVSVECIGGGGGALKIDRSQPLVYTPTNG